MTGKVATKDARGYSAKKNFKRISSNISDDCFETLKQYAVDKEKSIDYMVNLAIRRYIKYIEEQKLKPKRAFFDYKRIS